MALADRRRAECAARDFWKEKGALLSERPLIEGGCLEVSANTDGEVPAHHVFALGDTAKDRAGVSGRSDGIWGDRVEGVLHVEIGGHGRAVAHGELPGEGEVHCAEAGII